MPLVKQELIAQHQAVTFRITEKSRLRSAAQALNFVNERGFIFFWPVKTYRFPSLWTATAGDRLVADQHDDPGHVTWNWKDTYLDKRVWYYARVLRKKNTFISLNTLPSFFALSPNYGEPEADLSEQYAQGLLPLEAKLIFETLLQKGPLDTISLRKESRLSGESSQSPFNRAMSVLQHHFYLLPVGISQAGAWRYAFIYDLTHRYYPDLAEQARLISEQTAMDNLTTLYFNSMGAATLEQVATLFSFPAELVTRSLHRLVKSGKLIGDVTIEHQVGSFFALPDLISS